MRDSVGPNLRDRLAQESSPIACEHLIDGEVQRGFAELDVGGKCED